jgi:uncharacterized protein (DUF305 family)
MRNPFRLTTVAALCGVLVASPLLVPLAASADDMASPNSMSNMTKMDCTSMKQAQPAMQDVMDETQKSTADNPDSHFMAVMMKGDKAMMMMSHWEMACGKDPKAKQMAKEAADNAQLDINRLLQLQGHPQ